MKTNLSPDRNDERPGAELVWFRITVVVVSAAYCTGKALIWLNL